MSRLTLKDKNWACQLTTPMYNKLHDLEDIEDELGIDLNTSNFSTTKIDEETGLEVDDLTLSDVRVVINFNSDTGALESISIRNFALNNYEADVVLTFGEYRPFQLDAVDYQQVGSESYHRLTPILLQLLPLLHFNKDKNRG